MRFNLETQTWAAGVLRQVRLSTLPPGKRLRKFLLTCNLTGTLGAADTMTATNYANFLAAVKLSPRLFDAFGCELQHMQNAHHGRAIGIGANVGAPGGGGGTFDVTFVIELAMRNERQSANEDGSFNTSLLMGKSLEIQFAAAGGVLDASATVVITAGTIRIDADLCDGEAIPQFVETGYFNPGSQSIKLDPGVYLDLFLLDGMTLPSSVTPAEVSQVDLTIDGQVVLNNCTHAQLLAAYNSEAIVDSAAELTLATPSRLPIIWQNMRKGPATKQPAIEVSGLLQLAGTLTNPVVCYRRIALKDQATVDMSAAASGAPVGGSYEAALASKSASRQMHKSIREGGSTKAARVQNAALPGKIRLTETPGSKPA